MPSDDGNRPVMNVGFIDNVDDDDDAMNMNILDGGTPNQHTHFYNVALPPGMAMEDCSTDLSWTHIDAHLSDAASLFQNEPNSDLGNQGYEGESPAYSYPSSQPLWNTQQQSQKPLSTVADYALHEIKSDSLVRCPKPKATRDLRPLKPKSTPSSLGVVIGGNNNSITSQRPRKPSRRSGPLEAEGRAGASQMRHNRACLPCRLRKTKVSRGKHLDCSSV
jgi:hypothetical protein